MELQEIFDKVSNHLLTQNLRSTNQLCEITSCAYRGDNGTTCAIGCLIPDALYHTKLEGFGVANRKVKDTLRPVIGRVTFAKAALLLNLQHIHDNMKTSSWNSRLRGLANIHNLTFTPPGGNTND